jgi:hypothetical protein
MSAADESDHAGAGSPISRRDADGFVAAWDRDGMLSRNHEQTS